VKRFTTFAERPESETLRALPWSPLESGQFFLFGSLS
jgi:hypothetical protein